MNPIAQLSTATTLSAQRVFVAERTGSLAEQGRGAFWKLVMLVVFVYLVTSGLTGAFFMGDTVDYAASVAARARGTDLYFWDFGHLIWRPLGWLVFRLLSPVSSRFLGPDVTLNVLVVLIGLSWVGGLVSVVALSWVTFRYTQRTLLTFAVVVSLLFSNSFLNFTRTGCSYILGLCCLITGLCALNSDRAEHGGVMALGGGVALAGAVCLWINYLFAVPAVLVSRLFLSDTNKRSRRVAMLASIGFASSLILAYGIVIYGLGFRDLGSLEKWIVWASHGNQTRGLLRMVFGFPRSLINMGNDGMLFRRFIFHDSYNPVSFGELVRVSLLKLGLFYLFVGSVLMGLRRSLPGRKMLFLLLLNCLPVLAFAVMYDGGAIERYLALFPVTLVVLGIAFSNGELRLPHKILAIVLIALEIVAAAGAMSRVVLARKQEREVARIRDLVPVLKPGSWVMVPVWQDELQSFSWNFPLNPINRRTPLRVSSVITPGMEDTPLWREGFASSALSTWEKRQGEIWVSKRLLSSRPQADWNWVEGADPRVHWVELPDYFHQYDYAAEVGGEDGFVLLSHSARNTRLLAALANRKPGEAARK